MFAKREVQFTPERSAARLRVLQQFCASSPSAHPFVYFVAGPDGAALGDEDPSSQAVARYLFRGDYGRTLRNPVIADQQLEDTFVCLGADSVEVYRPAGGFVPGAARNMACWPNCQQLQPPSSMGGDTFQCEEFKIRSFLSTLKGRHALGFPAEAEQIERWPLVQAHALEEMGMGGF